MLAVLGGRCDVAKTAEGGRTESPLLEQPRGVVKWGPQGTRRCSRLPALSLFISD